MPESGLVALVPLRGGSKSIPRKNVRALAGKPMCAWALEAAVRSGCFDKVVVSTDCPEIKSTVLGLGLGIEVLDRPAELATDTASTESVMMHAMAALPFRHLVLIQATSPFTTAADFQGAVRKYAEEKLDSLVTGVRSKRFFWKDDGTPYNYDPLRRPRRQEFAGMIMENGAFYITSRALLEKTGCRLGGKMGVYEMPEETGLEIDEPSDWVLAEQILRLRQHKDLAPLLRNIKLVVFDSDGTLTDAGMYYDSGGDALRKFNTRDAKGIALLREKGVEVAILSTEDSEVTRARGRKLKLTHCLTAIEDKKPALLKLMTGMGLKPENVAYMGDDLNDLECLSLAGFSACPADAAGEVRAAVTYRTEALGGQGAVRECCDLILRARAS